MIWDSKTIEETPVTAQKSYVLGGFGYHGNLLVVFRFWFLVCRVSNFVCRYSESGLETPGTDDLINVGRDFDTNTKDNQCGT